MWVDIDSSIKDKLGKEGAKKVTPDKDTVKTPKAHDVEIGINDEREEIKPVVTGEKTMRSLMTRPIFAGQKTMWCNILATVGYDISFGYILCMELINLEAKYIIMGNDSFKAFANRIENISMKWHFLFISDIDLKGRLL